MTKTRTKTRKQNSPKTSAKPGTGIAARLSTGSTRSRGKTCDDADYETIEDDADDDLPEAEAIETSSYGDAAEPQDDAPHDHGYTGGSDDLDDLDDLAAVSADEDAILDEDALRELVADIVRQELQGALGERITRNVRKLVRREIHRALTRHELQ